jgi:hypothetical protein
LKVRELCPGCRPRMLMQETTGGIDMSSFLLAQPSTCCCYKSAGVYPVSSPTFIVFKRRKCLLAFSTLHLLCVRSSSVHRHHVFVRLWQEEQQWRNLRFFLQGGVLRSRAGELQPRELCTRLGCQQGSWTWGRSLLRGTRWICLI